MAAKKVTILMDQILWKTFRMACLQRNTAVGYETRKAIWHLLRSWGVTPLPMAPTPPRQAHEGAHHDV